MLYCYNKLLKVDYLYKFKNNYKVKKYVQHNLCYNSVYEEACNHKFRSCLNCNGLGWIAWKSNNNNNNNNNNSQSTIILYSICIKCQLN
jgi:hypothetical protein